MKKIKIELLESFEKSRGSYYILLPYRDAVYFKNKKTAEKAIRHLKQAISDNITIMGNVMSTLYQLHSNYYTQLPNLTTSQIIYNINSFNEQREYVYSEFGRGNQSMALSKIFVLFDSLDIVSNLLLGFAKSKHSHTTLVIQINSIKKELMFLKNNFKDELHNISSSHLSYRKHFKIVHQKTQVS